MSPTRTVPPFAALAAYGLPGSTHEVRAGSFTDTGWRTFLDGVAENRLQGQLAAVIRDGHLRVTERQRRLGIDLHRDALVQILRLERRLVRTAGILTEAGIDFRVLKGPAVARLVYARPDLRMYGDIDLIVPTERFDDAIGVLSRAGCQRRQPAIRPGFDRRFGKGVTLLAPDGLELDVHRTFVMGPFGLTVDLRSLFTSESSFELGGLTIPTLDPHFLLLHACYSVALGDDPPRLVSLRDAAELILSEAVDPARFIETAERSEASVVGAVGIARTWEDLRLAPDIHLSRWARSYEPNRRERRWLAAYRTGSYGALARTSLTTIDGLTDRLVFLRSVLVPSRGFLDDRSQGRAAWLWRGVRGAVSTTGRP